MSYEKPIRRHGSWFECVDEAVGDGHAGWNLKTIGLVFSISKWH
jgi:hypothetical protein